jgi:hypothetical protein
VSILIVLVLGPACMFYGYVLLHFWREMKQRVTQRETARGIVALLESSALQMQLDREPARASGARGAWSRVVAFDGCWETANRHPLAGKPPAKATVHQWPGTKDAA